MEILKTGIKDVGMINKGNGKKAKEKIGEDVLKVVYPILTEAYQSKKIELETKKEQIEKYKVKLGGIKGKVKPMMINLDREKKVKKLLEKVGLLEKTGLFLSYSNLRKEVIGILKVIDKLSDEVVERHSVNIVKILTKKVSK